MQKYKTEDLSKVEPGHGVPVRYAVVYLASDVDARIAELQQQVQRLKAALFFWLPSVPDAEHPLNERICNESLLLHGLDDDLQQDAEGLGWITLNQQLAQGKFSSEGNSNG